MSLGTKEFCEEVRGAVQEHYGRDFVLEVIENLKLNGRKEFGFTIRARTSDLAKVIYLNEQYEQYQLDEKSIDEIIRQTIEFIDSIDDMNVSAYRVKRMLATFELSKPHIYCRLIHTERNEAYLSDKPNIPFINLSIVFAIAVNIGDEGIQSVMLTNQMLEMWDVLIDDVYEAALENTRKLFGVKVDTMTNVLKNLVNNSDLFTQSDYLMGGVGIDFEQEESFMLVVSNNVGVNGATVMIYDHVLEEAANKLNSDKIVILPSSIHEVIIVKYEEAVDKIELQQMVREINTEMLEPSDVLADTPYVFDKRDKTMVIL